MDCSESFYKELVEEELRSQKSDPESARNMLDILKRMHENQEDEIDTLHDSGSGTEEDAPLDSDDEEDVPDLQERMKNVNLDNPNEIWSALTSAEKQEFEASLQNDQVKKLLPRWIPWWSYHAEKELIQDLEVNKESNNYVKNCPKILQVPKFNELLNASPSVRYNLLNVLYAYTYVALCFNGDHFSSFREAVDMFLLLCDNMRENKNFEDTTSAIESVVQNILKNDVIIEVEETISFLKNAVNSIIEGPETENRCFYISSALSDLYRLFITAKKSASAPKQTAVNGEFSKRFADPNHDIKVHYTKKDLRLCLKKLEYYLSWIESYGQTISINK
ncbi:zinc finger HIT domain-containing protein 2 isoform X2 [Cephus cinctus]|nr:zinc finger HIT domain-containing protein 2 isoform X2 [Cephus cinctus]